jgi:3-oxoacyl-(acyl-carrier-protein) synthase
MSPTVDRLRTGIEAFGCITPFGDERATLAALLNGRRALVPSPVLGADGGDLVPLALMDAALDDPQPPRWLAPVRALAARAPAGPWGTPRHPVYLTSSNFGVGTLYAYVRHNDASRLPSGTTAGCIAAIRSACGWGDSVTAISHACVSAHLGLAQAARAIEAGLADRALVLTFDFLSPFVTGGFHSLKILNAGLPAPFAVRETGSIGLGDGAAFAVLAPQAGPLRLEAHVCYNEMHHVTANKPDGEGFVKMAQALRELADGRRLWIKGHGTGTLEAGRLEAEAFRAALPDSPLVSWKGSLGHTLGSCGLVELTLAAQALATGRAPGTVGTEGPCFTEQVATTAFATAGFEAVALASNAFGGAHAAALLTHA